MKKKPNPERLLSFLFLLITLGVVLYVGFSGNDLNALGDALRAMSPAYLFLCLLSWMLYVLTDALAIHHFLRMQGQPIRIWQSLRAAMTGIYYSNVTPGATGGQPMEMYRLHKYGVSVGVSGSGMAVKFIVFQVVLLITGAVLWIAYIPKMASGMFNGADAEATGAAFNAMLASPGEVIGWMLVAVLIGFAICAMGLQKGVERITKWMMAILFVAMIALCIRVGVRIRLCKDPEASRQKWENHCESFLSSVHLVIRHPRDVLIQCLIALAQLMSLMLTIIAIYLAFGLSGATVGELITMGVLLYIGASYTPLPGASGAQEGGFAVLFRGIFPDAQLFVALLIWRFSTYYLSILAGVILTVAENVAALRARRSPGKGADA